LGGGLDTVVETDRIFAPAAPFEHLTRMMRTFIVGDIHGCYDELRELLQKAGLTEDDRLVSLGDVVDRGGKSLEVYRFLRTRPNTVVLMGNHERKHLNAVLSYAQEIVRVQFGAEYPVFLAWLQTLGYWYETDDAIIVHAAVEHDTPLTEQKPEVLSGSTAGERHLEKKYEGTRWQQYYSGSKPVIYGHSVVGDVPAIVHNTYGIDTGACHGGYLTAVELPGFIIHQVKAARDYWKEEQRIWQVPVLQAKDWDALEFIAIHKQLEKLRHVEQDDARAFLDALALRVQRLEQLHQTLYEALHQFTQKLAEEHGENFRIAAQRYDFRTFLFKSHAGNLKPEDVRNTLNTPTKVMALAQALALR
jgi:serine/threonine protein phosphatase 1